MRNVIRAGVVAIAATIALPLTAGTASAHPLGNFTINHYTGLVVRSGAVSADLVVDTAEIPTFKRRSEFDVNGDKVVDDAELATFSAAECAREVGRLDLRVGGRAVAFTVSRASLALLDGAAGLKTMRLECSATAAVALDRAGSQIEFTRRDPAGRIGWREITAQGDGVTLTGSTVPATSISNRLAAYPQDMLKSPLAVSTASLVAHPGGAALIASRALRGTSIGSRGVDAATAAFQKYVGRRTLSPLVGVVALLFAIVLGAVHALAPGHGKTVMAAFIVGERGSLRQAWIIALTVTITHTAGVLVLGVVLSAFDLAAPRVYGALGLASGLLLASVGVVLLARALRQRRAGRTALVAPEQVQLLVAAGSAAPGHPHPHPHDHDQEHAHPHPHEQAPEQAHEHPHPHPHPQPHEHAAVANTSHKHGAFSHTHAVPDPDKPLGLRSIIAMGFAGGLVPSPSALVVLLGAVALGRTWFGIVLVIAYGAGMALTLTGTGLLLSRASGRLGSGASSYGPRMQQAMRLAKVLPFVTAGVVLVVGSTIAFQGLRAALSL